jgi:hypothetical protein
VVFGFVENLILERRPSGVESLLQPIHEPTYENSILRPFAFFDYSDMLLAAQGAFRLISWRLPGFAASRRLPHIQASDPCNGMVGTGARVRIGLSSVGIIGIEPGQDAINAARPGGNLTGFASLYDSIAGKWVELLKEAAPRVERIGVVFSRADALAFASTYQPSIEAAAQALSVPLVSTPFRNAVELEQGASAFAAKPNGGLVVIPGVATATRDSRQTILLLAARNRVPVIHWDKPYPAEGGLMSYGSDFGDLYRRAAAYIDRILRGAKVSELPVEFPTRFELVINLKTAKALGHIIPPNLLALADEVIEE